MFEIIFISSIIALVLLVWFESEAFVEYATLVGGAKFFGVNEYKQMQEKNPIIGYHDYLLEKKDSFFVRLITCPLCFSFWVSVVTTFLVTDSILLFPICNVISLLLYKVTSKALTL